MKADSKKLREAEKLINILMDGLPEALQTLQDLEGAVLPNGVTLACPLEQTATKLLQGIQAYEAWAAEQGAWASR